MGQREPLIETAGKDANQGVAHLRVGDRVENMKSLPDAFQNSQQFGQPAKTGPKSLQ
ncbi:hypothetical protein SV7mr_01950 [Stieleria bergensis]|uniref:Uncharacterized protein n=1 Tax=Stieleria bergensis TaxID=2528025 RepID=A0A517SNL9_9BACT|nr:hypothetical protein SV7mr_01950 [Planctomycetes bacterium SV_7m_r]